MQRLLTALLYYFAIVGVLAHALTVTYGHRLYYFSGKPLNLFIYDINKKLEKRSPLVADIANNVLFASGLLDDPSIYLNSNLGFKLPPWKGIGANKLRQDTSVRYENGIPIPSSNNKLRARYKPPLLPTVRVDSVKELQLAISQAKPGVQIVLEPGIYRIPGALKLNLLAQGLSDAPIVLRGASIDEVVVEFEKDSGFLLAGSYWALLDIVFRGVCGTSNCSAPIIVKETAKAPTIRNIFASGFSALASGIPTGIDGLIEGVTIIGGTVTKNSKGWHRVSNKTVSLPSNSNHYIQICADSAQANICSTNELGKALNQSKHGALILMRSGTYRQAGIVKADSVTIMAEPGAHITEAAIRGKGAIVQKGTDLIIDGLECSKITVNDGNGTCVRQDKGNLTLRGVHFHHSQMGVLTGHKGGIVIIEDSYIHDSGKHLPGNLGHNIYVNSGELYFIRSWSLRAANEGHELKSRGNITIIEDSILASINSKDSRLIDLPNGGVFEMRNSILAKGPMSSSREIIGYGLELNKEIKSNSSNTIKLVNNKFISDRFGSAKLLHEKHSKKTIIKNNLIIGRIEENLPNNAFLSNREDAGLPDYPELFSK